MHHHTAAILSIGDELTLGQTLDTNARRLSSRLVDLGVMPSVHITIPDDRAAHARILTELAQAHTIIISTGGLGPTADDLTRHALADALGEELIEDEAALAVIRAHADKRGQEITPGRRLQALRPRSARMIDNDFGTAPGIHAVLDGCDIFCLPGPPREMTPMFESSVVPALRVDPARAITARVLRTFGLPEATLADRLAPIMARDANPTVGTTASGGIVSVRIRYQGPPEGAQGAIERAERFVREQIGDHIFGFGDDTLPSVVVRTLTERAERLVTVESCTGGTLAGAITDIPGSSSILDTGLVTYANESKARLAGVPAELIEQHGAVSEPVARAMAEGALRSSVGAKSTHALATTGIAGPGGGTPTKPVGTVFIARSWRTPNGFDTEVRRFEFTGNRADVRQRTVAAGLAMLYFHLVGTRIDRLLWQVPSEGTA